MAEAVGFAARGDFDKVPSSDNALKEMAAELKSLRNKVTLLYAATAIGAFFILAQGSNDASIEAFGMKLPLSLLSKQALALLVGAAFGYYAAALASAGMLYGTMGAIVRRDAPEAWEFLLARYDADMLWTNMLFPKKLGAPSPRSELIIAGIVSISNKAVVGGHILLIVGAIIFSLESAVVAGSWFGISIAALALIAASGAAIGTICAFFLKLRYTLPTPAAGGSMPPPPQAGS